MGGMGQVASAGSCKPRMGPGGQLGCGREEEGAEEMRIWE